MSRTSHDTASFVIPEPRITDIADTISSILSLVQFEKNGELVDIDGFRLRNLGQWVGSFTNTSLNALTPISSVCNSKCDFCFEENVPYAREQSLMSIEEARTRLKYYSPESGSSLFPSNRNHMETFVHPKAVELVAMARDREPGKVFWITTNGSHFTESVVKKLAELKPLIFKLSINSSNRDDNLALMHTGDKTDIALNAPLLLQKYKLPYVGGIVAWPTLSLASIEETVYYLEKAGAYAVRIRLPLTHKWLNHQLNIDFDKHWKTIAEFAHQIRHKVSVPIIVEPPLFWLDPIVPEIDGVIKNSPAYNAGLKPSDIVRKIENQPVHTRVESEAILDRLHMSEAKEISIEIERNEQVMNLILKDDDTCGYPYSSEGFFRGENYGILHIEDFRLNHIQKLLELINSYSAKNVLLFSSAIMEPIFHSIVSAIPEFSDQIENTNLYVRTIDENSFGGNYDVMDSRIVVDYAKAIRKHLGEGKSLDLILIPDAFGSPWGTDVYGASISDLTIEFAVPVEQVEWLMVYGRDV